MNSVSLEILILSFDGFEDLWQPCVDSLLRAWPDCPYRINLLTNFKNFDHPKVNSLQIGPDISWSDNLIKAINSIGSEYIFFLYDDAFITNIKLPEFQDFINFCLTNKLPSLLLRPHDFRGKEKLAKGVWKINRKSLYRNALFLNMMRREIILELLRLGENPWQFEVIGNSRSEVYDFFSIHKHIIKYDHAIVKGKWFSTVYNKYLNKGYQFKQNRGKFSLIKEYVYSIKYWIYIFCYVKILPLSIITLVEKLRSSGTSKFIINK